MLSLYCYRHFNLLITQSKHFVFVRERIDHDRKCVQKYKDMNARNFNKTLGLTTTTLNGALCTAFRLVQNLRSDRMKEPMIGLKRSTDATGVEPLNSPAQLICKSIRKNQISTDCRPTNERNDNYAVSCSSNIKQRLTGVTLRGVTTAFVTTKTRLKDRKREYCMPLNFNGKHSRA